MSRLSATAAAALAIVTLCCMPSTAFFFGCHMRASRPQLTFNDVALGILSRRSGSPSSGDGFSWARRESAWRSTSSSRPKRTRTSQTGGLLMSFEDEGGESNALLLRMDFEHAEVEELREWIRRWGSFSSEARFRGVLRHAICAVTHWFACPIFVGRWRRFRACA